MGGVGWEGVTSDEPENHGGRHGFSWVCVYRNLVQTETRRDNLTDMVRLTDVELILKLFYCLFFSFTDRKFKQFLYMKNSFKLTLYSDTC